MYNTAPMYNPAPMYNAPPSYNRYNSPDNYGYAKEVPELLAAPLPSQAFSKPKSSSVSALQNSKPYVASNNPFDEEIPMQNLKGSGTQTAQDDGINELPASVIAANANAYNVSQGGVNPKKTGVIRESVNIDDETGNNSQGLYGNTTGGYINSDYGNTQGYGYTLNNAQGTGYGQQYAQNTGYNYTNNADYGGQPASYGGTAPASGYSVIHDAYTGSSNNPTSSNFANNRPTAAPLNDSYRGITDTNPTAYIGGEVGSNNQSNQGIGSATKRALTAPYPTDHPFDMLNNRNY